MPYKHASATLLGAAAIAMAVGAVAAPAASQAAFNKASYDKCADAADKRWVTGQTNDQTHIDEYKFCCTRSGGIWVGGNRGCVDEAATAGTAPLPLPSQVATGPGQSSLPGTLRN